MKTLLLEKKNCQGLKTTLNCHKNWLPFLVLSEQKNQHSYRTKTHATQNCFKSYCQRSLKRRMKRDYRIKC